MLDPAFVRDHTEVVEAGLRARGIDAKAELEALASLEARRKRLIPELEGLKRQQNTAGDEVARAKRQGKDASGVFEANRARSQQIRQLDIGSITLGAPMIYAINFLLIFTIGGLTGLFLAALSTDVHLHDTYFVVAHFHYVMAGSNLLALIGGLHYWWPKMYGRFYNESVAKVAAVLIFIGFNATFLPQFLLGSRGMPRRYYNYLEQFQTLHQFSTLGSWILAIGLFLALANLLASLRNKKGAVDNPWGGKTLEWETTSPPTTHNFLEQPVLKHGPYDYRPVPAPVGSTEHAHH